MRTKEEREAAAKAIQAAHDRFYANERKRYYNLDQPQCKYRCIVGATDAYGIGGRIHICEFAEGHQGPHDLTPTMRLATADVASKLDVFPAVVDCGEF